MHSTPQAIVTAQGLTKSFSGYRAVNGISFDVFPRECLGILGPNGAGKTTTLQMLLGLAIPDAGQLSVLEFQLPRQAQLMRAQVGVVPQQDNLDPDFTVIENLYTYARYFGLRKTQIEKYVHELLVFTALENRANSKVIALSGGMRRRLILARALLNQPKLIILDEPTTGLDPQARQLIWQRLHSLKTQGTSLILTTHYMEEAERLCDRILIMDKGNILARGTPRDLIKEYIEPCVIEVRGEALDQWYEKISSLANQRIERVGETIFYYCQDDQTLLQELSRWSNLEFIRRPANLEDVFIRLTGRSVDQ